MSFFLFGGWGIYSSALASKPLTLTFEKKEKEKKCVPSFPFENSVVESEASQCCGPKGIKLLRVTSLL